MFYRNFSTIHHNVCAALFSDLFGASSDEKDLDGLGLDMIGAMYFQCYRENRRRRLRACLP